MRRPRILITGRGIGGLTAALVLIRRGIRVELPEQAGRSEEARRDRTARVVRVANENASRFHDPEWRMPTALPPLYPANVPRPWCTNATTVPL